ncbi:response receiver histidine kinase [Geotalea daltonii FRC-32]|uniref:histidine kinase n=1 Tax=Geotalea daltonii (strain DSM 22248 / JCM 15807 / FRC-32) TaxID=316067 RepID=B9M133_GEODF|nr:response regulator [Geotalea daltonii]ACM19103.1 response receiver histidine kinase [Geotalea daltonii FRC-32]
MARILVIEDSSVAQAQLADILSGSYVLDFSDDGAQGIAIALENPPDLILLDVHLPALNGYEVCRKLKHAEQTRDTPIIFITAMDAEREKVKGFEAGAVDYIVKPFYPQELLARIRSHLAAQSLARQSMELEKLKLFKEMAIALSHEINNPLTSIYGSLYMLEKDNNSHHEHASSALQQIRQEMGKIRDIVAKLARTTRISQTEYLCNEKMIDLHKL